MKLKLVLIVTIVFLGTMILSFRSSSVTGPQSADTIYPTKRATVTEYVRKAKEEGKNKVIVGAPIGMPRHVNGLSDALSALSLLVVEPVAQKSYVEGGNRIITWIKFKIIEDLSRPDLSSTSSEDQMEALPQEIADALLPVRGSEILVPQAGGVLTQEGVTVISETPDFPLLSMDQRYLLFVERSPSGKIGKTELGPHSVFTISEQDQISSLVPQDHPVSRDIRRFYGDSLGRLKEKLEKRSNRN